MSATQPADSSDGPPPGTSETPAGIRTVEVDGEPVAYAAFGDPAGEPVVFFHGTPGSRRLAELYDDAAREQRVRVLAFDRPGYGRSPTRPGYEPADTADVLAAVLADASVERAGVVAFSGGAPHALAAAAESGDRVRGVDVVSGSVPAPLREETPTPQRVLGGLAGSTPRLLAGLLRGQAWLARRLSPSFVLAQYTTEDGRDALPGDVENVVKQDFLEAFARSRAGAVREFRHARDDWDVSLASVDCRVRWWHGGDDENVPLAGARRVADALPDCDLRVLGDADHLGALVRSREGVLSQYAPDE
ncbi:alpha/beta fold hydrolase [Halobacterium zhouii]|uniref:alpha/beta fold hydrolase n=1 Tax=Halobacterium zhouii TaxID=2902624 RepID=UPI001E600565|nr:alpha/beta hydrolase [Halobacterium zhouii]